MRKKLAWLLSAALLLGTVQVNSYAAEANELIIDEENLENGSGVSESETDKIQDSILIDNIEVAEDPELTDFGEFKEEIETETESETEIETETETESETETEAENGIETESENASEAEEGKQTEIQTVLMASEQKNASDSEMVRETEINQETEAEVLEVQKETETEAAMQETETEVVPEPESTAETVLEEENEITEVQEIETDAAVGETETEFMPEYETEMLMEQLSELEPEYREKEANAETELMEEIPEVLSMEVSGDELAALVTAQAEENITDIVFGQVSQSVQANELCHYVEGLSVIVDGTSGREEVTGWKKIIRDFEGGGDYFAYQGSNGNDKEIIIELYSDAGLVSFPEADNEFMDLGNYTLRAYMKDLPEKKAELQVTVVEPNSVSLYPGKSQELEFLDNGSDTRMAVYRFAPDEMTAGYYSFYINWFDGMVPPIQAWELRNGKFSYIAGSGGFGKIKMTLEAGITYYYTVEESEGCAEGTVYFEKKKEISSVNFADSSASYSAFDLKSQLTETSVIVTYKDGSRESINQFHFGINASELSAQTSEGAGIVLEICDLNTGEGIPFWVNDIVATRIPLGRYKLVMHWEYFESYEEEVLDEKTIEITMPEVIQITPDQEYEQEESEKILCAFSPTVDTEGEYIFSYKGSAGEKSAYIYQYVNGEYAVLEPVAEQNIGTNISILYGFEASNVYYIVGYSDDGGDGNRFCLKKKQYETSGLVIQYEDMETSVSVLPAGSVKLSVLASANEGIDIGYCWYDENGWIEGEYNSEYTVENVQKNSQYRCRVFDGYGNEEYVYFHVSVDSGFKIHYDEMKTEKRIQSGDNVTLKVVASAPEGVDICYQWYYDQDDEEENIELSGEVKDSLELIGVINSDSGYYCRVWDNYGNYKIVSFDIMIDSGLSVNWDEIETNVKVAYGEGTVLRMSASANPGEELYYQWYDQNNETSDLIEDANSSEYTIDSVTGMRHYACEVRDKYGYYEYVNYYVSVDSGLTIHYDEMETGKMVQTGGDVTLKVVASAYEGVTIRYQWCYNLDGEYRELPGEVNDSLELTGITNNNFCYCCRVSDSYGNYEIVSFDIMIDSGLSVNWDEIETSVRVAYGEDAVLKMCASANPGEKLSYQWYLVDDDYEWEKIEGASETYYTVENVQKYQQYICEVSDNYGINQPVSFYVGLESGLNIDYEKTETERRARRGGAAELALFASANPEVTLSYQWYFVDENYEWEEIADATESSYTVTNVRGRSTYCCQVTDSYRNTECAYFYVSEDSGLKVNNDNGTISIKTERGENAVLSVTASVDEGYSLNYQWYQYIRDDSDNEIVGENEPEYIVEKAQEHSIYYCKVNDNIGNTEWVYFEVKIESGLAIDYSQTTTEVKAEPGEKVTLSVKATTQEDVTLSYQWYDLDWNPIEGATNVEFIVTYDQGVAVYRCIVSDSWGNSKVVNCIINGIEVDYEKTQLMVTAVKGQDVTLSVTATSGGTLIYQWMDGEEKDISGANEPTYTVKNVQENSVYWCMVGIAGVNIGVGTYYLQFHVNIEQSESHKHSFGTYYPDHNATCLSDGTKTAKCEFCNETDTIVDVGSALGHSFINYVSDQNASCTEDGTRTAKCERCAECSTIPDVGSALGHSYTNYVSDGNATCTTDGTKTAKCDRCPEKNTVADAGSALGHSYTNYVSDRNATCTTDGTKTAKCDRCAAKDTVADAGSALGHSYTNYVSDGNATCTEDGTKTAKCDRCTVKHTVADPDSAVGHKYSRWTTTKAPTALQKGLKTRCCSVCKIAESQTLPKLKAVIELSVKGTLPLNVKQSTTAVRVTKMTKGDAIKSWKSSNSKIAVVNSKGKITGKKAGIATITVTLKSGKKAAVKIKVQNKKVTTAKLTVTGKNAVIKSKKLTLKKGKSVQLLVAVSPVTSTDKITYTTSDKKIATVSKAGKITAKKAGKVKITVKSGKKKTILTVTVKK